MVSKIIWTRQALNNLKEIKDFVSKDSEFYASRLIDLIYDSVNKLIKYPEAGKVVSSKQLYVLRRILVKRYIIIYTIADTTLFIVTVHHSSRHLPPGTEIINLLPD